MVVGGLKSLGGFGVSPLVFSQSILDKAEVNVLFKGC